MVATTGDGRCTVTASAGAALYPRHGDDAKSLIAAADAALYTAKAAGRNCCVVAMPITAGKSPWPVPAQDPHLYSRSVGSGLLDGLGWWSVACA